MPLPSSTVAAQAATIISFFVTGRILSVRFAVKSRPAPFDDGDG
jgi:hypothetical protein